MQTVEQASIFVPFLGMMGLTLSVWLYMYVRRLAYILGHGMDAQSIATPEKAARVIPDNVNNASNNLRNLFELPVLFYALSLYLFVTMRVDGVFLACAWSFLVFRVVHSAIHCTVNHVPSRFAAYVLASLALWIMLIRNAWMLLQ